MQCPLCDSQNVKPWYEDKLRPYHRCPNCDLVFVPRQYHLSAEAEKAEYDKHQNHVDDTAYQNFLKRLFDPACRWLKPGSEVLDFGCGPGPALAEMFRKAGYLVSVYDIYYANNIAVLDKQFELVTATEVFEHLRHPGETIRHLVNKLKPGAMLGIMTKLHFGDIERFAKWHYIQDPTHIAFYSERTLLYIAGRYNLFLMPVADDAFLFLDAGVANLV